MKTPQKLILRCKGSSAEEAFERTWREGHRDGSWCLLFIFCSLVWSGGNSKERNISVSRFGVTTLLMLTKLLHLRPEQGSLSARKIWMCCIPRGLQVFTVWICNYGKISTSKKALTNLEESEWITYGHSTQVTIPWQVAKSKVYATSELFPKECRLCCVKGISRIQVKFQTKVAGFALAAALCVINSCLDKNLEWLMLEWYMLGFRLICIWIVSYT